MSTSAPPPFWRETQWWRRAAGATGGLSLATALALAGSVAAARGLGADDFGRLTLAVAIAACIAVVLDISFEDALVQHGSRRLEAGDERGLRALLRFGLRADLVIGLAVFALVSALAGPIAQLVRDSLDPNLIRIAALMPLTNTVDGVTGVTLLLARRPDLRAYASAVGNGVRLVAVIIVVQADAGAAAVLWAFVAGSLASSAVQAWWALRLGWRTWGETGAGEPVPRRAVIGFATHASLSSSFAIARESLATLVVGNRAGERAAGLFSVAMLPVTAALVLASSLRLAVFGEQTRLWVRGEVATLRRSLLLQSAAGAAVGIPAAVLGWITMPWLIRIVYGERYGDALDAARWLLVPAVCALVAGWAKTLPSAVNRPRVRTLMAAFDVALLLPLLWVLADRNGVTGAAVAVAINAVVVTLVWFAVAAALLREVPQPAAVTP